MAMSGDITNPVDRKEIFEKFAKEIGLKHECPFCEGRRWSIIDTPSVGMEMGHVLEARKTEPTGRMEYFLKSIVMECEKCGFVRSHATSRILTWLNSAETKVEADE